MIKKIKVMEFVIFIIIVLSFILMGTSIKYNCRILNIAIILIGVIYAIYKIVVKKETIRIEKIDIFIVILFLSSIIPLIFGTYSSLEETLLSIVKNISILSLYITTKDVISKNDKKTNFITNAILISGVILVILGIDELTTKII